MNIVLPFEPQISNPNQYQLGMESAQIENANKSAIPAASSVDNSSQAGGNNSQTKQDSPKESHADQVTLSERAISKSKESQNTDEQALSEDEQKQVQELKDRDREVKIHEQAHAAVGGQYAGAPTYEYETGPDGKRYAVGGEVSIDVSEEAEPEDTVQKMQIVRAAALAPAEPSTQDLKVAAEASQKENQARAQISQDQLGASPKQQSKPSNQANSTIEDTSTTSNASAQLKIANAYQIDSEKVSSSFGIKA